jgi:4-hydroxy-2-oxoheptanedioate aldolase
MEEAVGKIRDAGKAPGTFAGNPESARRWISLGMQYVSLGCDVGIFGDACKKMIADTKGAYFPLLNRPR